VTYIGEVAFQAMETLTSVTFLNTDPTTITFGDDVFQACDNLTAIYVPAGKVDDYKTALPDYVSLIVEGGAPTPATSGSCGTNATWSYSNGIMTIGGSGAMTDYSSSMTDIPWIDYQTSITRVVIGDEITHVGNWAFQGCTALNSVTIGENVTSIGNGSFDNCTNDGFTVLTIPNSVQTIGIDAFSNNHLKYVCFGSGLTSIGMEAFMVCQDLEAIGVYASTPPTLGMEAFMACNALASIYVPSAKITDYTTASGWSDYAAMIKSPSGECGTDATWSFEMATGTLTIEGTGAIDDFSGWDSTQDNDSRAFNPFNAEWYPYGIKSVVIGEGITEIPISAFYMEVGITDVTLPSTLTAIGMDAFGECDNIETITCDATTPPTLADTGDESYVFYANDFTDPNNPVTIPIATITAIYVPAASVTTYKAAAGWSDYADKIQAQAFTLAEDVDNRAAINGRSGKTCDVTVKRTLYKDGYWNTLCLPFDVSTTSGPLAGDNVVAKVLNASSELVNGTLTLNFSDAPATISAGTPFIIKWNNTGENLTENDLVFTGVTIDKTNRDVAFSGGTFMGNYKPLEITDANRNDIVVLAVDTNGNKLGYVNTNRTLGAFHAYFYIPGSTQAREFVLNTDDETTTGIISTTDSTDYTDKADAIYDLQGRRVAQPTKGLYIVNGRKVVIK